VPPKPPKLTLHSSSRPLFEEWGLDTENPEARPLDK
jgi:hypothetical protein